MPAAATLVANDSREAASFNTLLEMLEVFKDYAPKKGALKLSILY